MNAVIKGAKGGSKSQRQPKIANDTTASKTYARLQYGMSEGEVEGLANGFKSIFLDDTPVESDSGARNFQDVTLDFRSGTNDQTYMEGFESIASEAAVGVELKSDTPWVKGITNLNLDAVIVRVRFGALKKQDPSNGDVSGIVIDYSIEVQTDGGAWELMLDTKMSGKTSANYERTHRIGLPKANNNWLIRVTRKTPNSSSEYVSDKMYIQAITEVIDLKLTYPNTAVIGVQYDAETFSNIAKIAVDLKGVKIKVPSNYDPVSRTYIGIWDGTFKRAYSNNPAWIYYDLCTNKRYALGNRLTEQMIDKWSLYRLAQYCDQMVNDGKGGQEPRFTCNVYIQSAESAFDILSKLAGVFRAISYWDGNSIVCDADLPQDTYFTYTRANVIDGHFEYSGTRARDRHNAVKVAWDNPQNRYKTEYVFVRDEAAIARDRGAVKLLELEAWGCTSEGQAQRAGLWALKSEQLETRTVSFKVGLDGYIPLPGKVIEVADELLAGRANGGRISAVSADRKIITLDRDDVVCRAGDRLVVNGEDGKAQTRIVSSKIGRKVTVTVAFDSVAAENVWVVDAQDLKTMKFRVMSITQDDKHQFSITGLQYESAKYNAIDFGAFIDDRPISIINPTIQAPVTNVLISSENMVQQGLSIETMLITWDQAQGATKYQAEWRKDDGNWIKLPITGSNSVEVQGIYAGNYEARVTAISAFDIASLPTYSVLTTLSGKQGLPPALANIAATGILFGYRLNWNFPAVGALDTAYTEIEIASTANGANAAQLGLFAYPTNSHVIQGMQPNLTRYFRGRLIDRIGNIGPWSQYANATTSADASAVLDILSGAITETQLHQDMQTKIDKIDGNSIAISQEVIARAAAITSEAQSRATAISTEKTERQSADSNLSQRIDTVSASAANNAAAIQTEATARADADSALATQINTVQSATTTAQNTANSAQTAATNAATLAGNKGEVIFGATAPTADKRLAQNLWIDTTGGANTPKRWSGSAWVAVTDKAATDAAAAATAAQTAANNALSIANTATTNLATVQTKVDTLTTQQSAQATQINTVQSATTTAQNTANSAQTAATNAATLAGNKGEVIFGATAPTADKRLAQNLWIDTTGGANTPKRWSGSAWVAVTDKAATDAAAAATAAQTAANNALSIANTATTNLATVQTKVNTLTTQQSAQATQINTVQSATTTAQNTANSAQTAATNAATLAGNKGEVIFGATAPTADKRLAQNLWIDTTGGANTPKRWSGSAWVAVTDKAATDAAAAATAAQTAANNALSIANTATTNLATVQTKVNTLTTQQSAQASQVSTIQTTVGQHTASIQTVSQSVNGLYAQKYIKLDVNDKVAGWGGANTGKESNFIVNFDSFAIGSGGSTGYYPFIFRTTPYTDPNTGTVFPVGAYLKTAFMDYASIDTAHIKQLAVKTAQIDNLAVKTAQIDNLAVTTAKIGDLQVDTLKIKDRAVTVPITLSKPAYSETITGGGAYTYISNDWYTTTLTGLTPNGDVLIFLKGLFSATSRVTSPYDARKFRLSIRLVLAANGTDIKNLYTLSKAFNGSTGEFESNVTNAFGSSDFPIVNLVKADSSGNVTLAVRSEHWSNYGSYAFDRSHSDVILHALELKK